MQSDASTFGLNPLRHTAPGSGRLARVLRSVRWLAGDGEFQAIKKQSQQKNVSQIVQDSVRHEKILSAECNVKRIAPPFMFAPSRSVGRNDSKMAHETRRPANLCGEFRSNGGQFAVPPDTEPVALQQLPHLLRR